MATALQDGKLKLNCSIKGNAEPERIEARMVAGGGIACYGMIGP